MRVDEVLVAACEGGRWGEESRWTGGVVGRVRLRLVGDGEGVRWLATRIVGGELDGSALLLPVLVVVPALVLEGGAVVASVRRWPGKAARRVAPAAEAVGITAAVLPRGCRDYL